jgi:hypothetical protein
MTTAAEIAHAIHAAKNARKEVASTKVALMELAVDLGLDQETAMKVDLAVWLDGYLQGAGVMPEYRRVS